MATKKPATKTPAKTALAKKQKPETKAATPLTRAEAKHALARETKAIVALGKDVSKNAWQIGRRLLQVSELDLHRAAGFASVEDYAETACSISKTTAFMYMRVAGAFSEEVAATYGMDKLDRGLSYIARTPEDEKASDVPKLKIRVPSDDGSVHEKAFDHVTVRELRLAAAHEAGAPAKPHVDPNVAPHAAAVSRANRALSSVVGKSNAARAEVSAYARDGLVLFDVRAVPLAHADAALEAVRAALA